MTVAERALNPEELRDRILQFIASCSTSRPVLKEEGTEPIALEAGRFSVETQHGKVLLEAWDDTRSVVRRVVGIRRESVSEMVFAYRRFGSGEGTARILASAKSTRELQRDAGRAHFAERLRKLLAQVFPEWKLEQLSAERDLAHSFSAHVVRARLRRGTQCWAVAGCAEQEGEAAADAALAQGLAWLDYLRKPTARPSSAGGGRKPPLVSGLKLFLPERFSSTTLNRLPFLNSELAACEAFLFDAEDQVRPAPPAEPANLATEIPPASSGRQEHPAAQDLIRRLAAQPGVTLRTLPGVGATCAIRGLVFARAAGEDASFGHGDDWQPLTPGSLPEAMDLARRIAALRCPESSDTHHVFYTAQAERWLESLLLADIEQLSAELDPRHVYSQVPAIGGRERGIIDLLAVTRYGRLVVIELKASPDLNLPLQALDYWMRVKWHLDRGEFARLGYFPGMEISPEPPLLWLVTPAFDFHPLNEVALRYLSPKIPVRYLGLNHEWRKKLQVVARG